MSRKITDKLKLKIVFILGILLRTYYVIAVPVVQNRQYDLGSVDVSNNIFTGHLGYIYYLFVNKKIPDFDPREVYQFFHPPLHHGIEALWLNIVNIFIQDFNTQLELLQIPTLVYSVLILCVIYALLMELNLQPANIIVVMVIVAFHPTLIFMAGSLNNDGLSLLFQFLIMWLTVRWYNNRSDINIIFIALAIGLGMLTKLSVGLFAIPVAFLFAYVFVTEIKGEKKFPTRRFAQYVLFGIICIPIGMAWAVRCLVKFNMPLMYVNKLPEDSWQYIGNYSLWQRFGIPNPILLLSNLSHGSLGFGENMWMQMFRTAALGECDLAEFPYWGKIIAMLMLLVSAMIAIWAFIEFVRNMVIDRDGKISSMMGVGPKWFLILVYFASFFSYVKFCYGYPHQCTMNFRYMVPTILAPSIALGYNKQSYATQFTNIVLTFYAGFSILVVFAWVIPI